MLSTAPHCPIQKLAWLVVATLAMVVIGPRTPGCPLGAADGPRTACSCAEDVRSWSIAESVVQLPRPTLAATAFEEPPKPVVDFSSARNAIGALHFAPKTSPPSV